MTTGYYGDIPQYSPVVPEAAKKQIEPWLLSVTQHRHKVDWLINNEDTGVIQSFSSVILTK